MAEKITYKKKLSLWMRYVDFKKLKDLLHIVHQNDGVLRPMQLENLGIKMGVLTKEDGTPLKHSARYHYRKVMEGLRLVKKNKKYHISDDERIIRFLKLTEFKKDMSEEAKEILREIIVDNLDCRKYFFNVFMEEDNYTLKDLRKKGNYAIVETEGLRIIRENIEKHTMKKYRNKGKRKRVGPVIFRSPIGKILKLSTQDYIHAIYWGVRLWSLDLEIIDEILLNYAEGRIMYPINPDYSEKLLMELLLNKIKSDISSSEWITLRLPILIKEIALVTRYPIRNIKLFLKKLKSKYPTLIMFIPSSTMFIDIKTPYEKQEKAIRNLYLYFKSEGFISHIRINKQLLEEVSHEQFSGK